MALEPISGDDRLTTFPINRPGIFSWYTTATHCFWNVEEISVGADVTDYKHKLTPGMQHFVKHILAFFAASDGIVNINIAERFKKELNILEANYFYDFQMVMENIHAHTYSILLDAIVPSAAERAMLFNAIETMPTIATMSRYMFDAIASDEPLSDRLLRMACVEGIFFTACFCAIYWLGNRGLMPALCQSNELISRDEGLHTMFALYMYTLLREKSSPERVTEIMKEAVAIAVEFFRGALPDGLPEMNVELMIPYIESQVDNLVTLIDLPPIYGSTHSFAFMNQINMASRTNFFERRATEYARAQTCDKDPYAVDEDF